ncbi:hypothetical protein [Actinophytocola sediminis]
MKIKTFTLETVDDCEDNVYAIGMSITVGDDQEVLVFRRDPSSGQATFMSTTTPARALDNFQRIMPMRLVWTHDQDANIDGQHCPGAVDMQAGR